YTSSNDRTLTSHGRRVSAGRRGARDPHGARGGRVLRAGVSPRARAGAGGALGGEIHAGRDVLYAPEGRQQGLHVLVRRAALARGGRDGGAAVPAARGLD